jgi:hypothetical protein
MSAGAVIGLFIMVYLTCVAVSIFVVAVAFTTFKLPACHSFRGWFIILVKIHNPVGFLEKGVL